MSEEGKLAEVTRFVEPKHIAIPLDTLAHVVDVQSNMSDALESDLWHHERILPSENGFVQCEYPRCAKLSRKELTAQCARLRPRLGGDMVRYATKTSALTLALIAGFVKQTAPGLLNVYGVGTDVAAAILVAVGDNPERIRTEAAFAKLCGVAPLPANSGKRTDGTG
jgi:hypothetical protein